MPKYLDDEGLLYFWQKIKNVFTAKADAIKSITRSGTTFTATRADGTTFTFTQQDNDTWNANTKDVAGYVAAPTSSNPNKVWGTDSTGAPGWRDESGAVTGVKGDSETDYRTGNVNITKANIGLGNVDNTADASKSVASAAKLTTERNINGFAFDGQYSIKFYGTCTTAATTPVKTVSLAVGNSNFTVLTGVTIYVKFSSANKIDNPTLRIGTHEAAIYGNGEALTMGTSGRYIKEGCITQLTYDGTYWQAYPLTNTTYEKLTQATATDGTETTGKIISAKVLHDSITELMPDEYIHPAYTAHTTSAIYKITNDATGHVDSATAATANDIVTLLGTTPVNRATADASGNSIADTYARKTEIAGMYKYKGSVASESLLPTTGQSAGDVYNIETASTYGAAGANVAWNGSAWDSLGEIFTIASITNAEIDTIIAS